MELELGIIREPAAGDPKQRLRVFGESGGTIGRAPDNYWVLPDPKCYLSSQHCEVFFSDGAFWVRDTSRNGVFLNRSQKPIGFGHVAQLSDGDELAIVTYLVRVKLRTRSLPAKANETRGQSQERQDLGRPVNCLPATVSSESAVHLPAVLEAAAGANKGEPSGISSPAGSTAPKFPSLEGAGAADPGHGLEDTIEHENILAVAEPPDRQAPGVGTTTHADALAATRTLGLEHISHETTRVIHVDKERLRLAGHLPPQSMERLVSNQFRHIKRPLMRNALGKGVEPVPGGHLVMVTSALPGEGKTFTSINLALSLAREKDLSVVLIDADVAKKDVSKVFGIADEPGLLDALTDDMLDVESLIIPTDLDGFSILPAGHYSEIDVATELLSSSRMEDVAARIGARNTHRIALFDSPPILLTNESRVLTTVVGQVVLVVRAGVTPQQAVLEAISCMESEKPLGLVLNQSRLSVPGSRYGYGGYGYKYGVYGYGSEP